ncbi:MAG: ABC transporter permease [Gammaproteobacteria bacterium]|nr:ABC transporter permease [Gammaproteobacteria bacterium]
MDVRDSVRECEDELPGAATPVLPVRVYTARSRLRDPAGLLREMRADLFASGDLATRLFLRNLMARYRQTLLGGIWLFLPPVAATVVFVFLRRVGVFATADTGVPYLAYVFTGLVLWQTFVDALYAPLRMVSQSRTVLVKVNFPREALILAGAAEVAFNLLVRSLPVAAILVWFGLTPSVDLLWVPAGAAVLISTGLAIGLLLVPVASLYQDAEQALSVILPMWMLFTPVIYPPPVSFPASLTVQINPVAAVLDTTRAWVLAQPPQYLPGFLWTAVAAVLLLACGWLLFRLALPIIIERMGS